MLDQKRTCIDRLSAEERASLKKLCGTRADRKIPADHEDKLLNLRLVEVNCGELYPTSAGRSVLYCRDK